LSPCNQACKNRTSVGTCFRARALGPEPLAQAADKLEVLQANRLRVAHEDGTLCNHDLKRVTVDTTVQRSPSPSQPTKLLPPAAIKEISRLASKPRGKLR